MLVSDFRFAGKKSIPPGDSAGAGPPNPNFGSSVDGRPFRGRGVGKFLISCIGYLTACKVLNGSTDSCCNIVLYYDVLNMQLGKFYNSLYSEPVNEGDIETQEGRVQLADHFLGSHSKSLRLFFTRERDAHLHPLFFTRSLKARLPESFERIDNAFTLQQCMFKWKNIEFHCDYRWCIKDVSSACFQSLQAIFIETKGIAEYAEKAGKKGTRKLPKLAPHGHLLSNAGYSGQKPKVSDLASKQVLEACFGLESP